jgi:hypothetical protein
MYRNVENWKHVIKVQQCTPSSHILGNEDFPVFRFARFVLRDLAGYPVNSAYSREDIAQLANALQAWAEIAQHPQEKSS